MEGQLQSFKGNFIMFTFHSMDNRSKMTHFVGSLAIQGWQRSCGVFMKIDLVNKEVYIGSSNGHLLDYCLKGANPIARKNVNGIIAVSLQDNDVFCKEYLSSLLIQKAMRCVGFKLKNKNSVRVSSVTSEQKEKALEIFDLFWAKFLAFVQENGWTVQEAALTVEDNVEKRAERGSSAGLSRVAFPRAAEIPVLIDIVKSSKGFDIKKMKKKIEAAGYLLKDKTLYNLIIAVNEKNK